MRKNQIYHAAERVVFPLLLLLYPMRHIMVGVEWWDTGYNYGNFMYMGRMADPMWIFSTYLGHALGNLFTRLPFGGTMMGMNVYTGLLVSLLALGGYYFFTRTARLPAWIAFAGEMLAISLCWCPTALLYNYLTYVLFAAGVVLLYYALTGERKVCFVLAGLCLGVNVFVRFPNLAQMALIAAVWAYGFICRRKLREVAAQTGWCVLGYAAGILLCLGGLALRYGLDAYTDAIGALLSMPSEASDYTITSMVVYQLRNYQQNLIWLGYLLLFTALGVLGLWALPKRFSRLARAGYICCVFAGFYYLMQRNMFNLKYSTKLSVFQWAVFLLTATILAGLVTIVRKNAAREEKLLSGLGILVILITPLGSNNHLYSSMNNLFLVAPFTLWLLARFLRWLPGELKPGGRVVLSLFPVKAMILCMLLMLGIQSIGFGIGYVFSESDGGENLNTRIENNDILKGMYTSPDRAEAISTISAYVEERGLVGSEAMYYGQIPSLAYYLGMPPVITSWPDLRSYNYAVMEEDLRELAADVEEEGRSLPVILLEAGYAALYLEEKELLGEMTEQRIEAMSSEKKFQLLEQWMDRYSYQVSFRNHKVVLLEAGGNTEMR